MNASTPCCCLCGSFGPALINADEAGVNIPCWIAMPLVCEDEAACLVRYNVKDNAALEACGESTVSIY